MSKHEEIISKILNDMTGIGGVPSDQEFYDEFNSRLREELDLESYDIRQLSDVPSEEEIEKYLKYNYSTDPSEAEIYLGTNIIATGAIRKFIRWMYKRGLSNESRRPENT